MDLLDTGYRLRRWNVVGLATTYYVNLGTRTPLRVLLLSCSRRTETCHLWSSALSISPPREHATLDTSGIGLNTGALNYVPVQREKYACVVQFDRSISITRHSVRDVSPLCVQIRREHPLRREVLPVWRQHQHGRYHFRIPGLPSYSP